MDNRTIWRIEMKEVEQWQLPIVPNPDVPGEYILNTDGGQIQDTDTTPIQNNAQ